ncbi:Thiamine-phosphate synthase [Botrimarina colliarenosi]|uniref:Thiamine-phosphate synthase n=1 Tax=Botrimarina colliarenosi TaxID=2528001 RepID=A0A5C6AJK6_9BACT|nr:thiamine phosphate synthase [Botrimarina colliarenosi]TWT99576.1 Thiamine-phosphate synthase [Botrimarina colliarenosi]
MPDTSPPDPHVIRLMDASLNRASEGARVVEDYARFVLDDAHLSRLGKELRHGIAAAGATLPMADRLACRNTPGDVGTAITTASESQRADAADVCNASLGRLQEALRSLEEYGKTIDPALGAAFERLRYDAYTLAAGLGTTERGRNRLGDARLYVLIEAGPSDEAFEQLTESLCAAGVQVLQLRDKRLDDRRLVERARIMAAVCRRHGVVSIVNDRADIAVAAGADGVHIGQDELTVADARSVVGPGRLVGVSTHRIEQARAARLAGADYLGVGPTFPSTTKSFADFPGIDFVRQVAAEITLPAFAIGGITAENISEVVAAGLRRVAVGAAVTGASDPAAAVRSLREALGAPVGGEGSSG